MAKRIAIFHQFLDNIGGAEVVTLTLARELEGDVFTTNISDDKISQLGFEDVLPRIHSIGSIPTRAPWRHQLALWRFARINLSGQYDQFIVSGDWAVSAMKHNRPAVWYVHSPCRELWDIRQYIRSTMVPWYARPIFDLWTSFNRWLLPHYMAHADSIICNSQNTQSRLKKYLNTEAEVVHPPCDTKQYYWEPHQNYWLSVNRLLPTKRIELQLEAFRRLPNEKLIVVGSYEKGVPQFENYKRELERHKPDNVEFRHWVSDTELKRLYAQSKGLVCTALDEDFGMTPVEAMASGKPVIAINEGGYRETVIDEKTGYLLNEPTTDALTSALQNASYELETDPARWKEVCHKRATHFSTDMFITTIQQYIT